MTDDPADAADAAWLARGWCLIALVLVLALHAPAVAAGLALGLAAAIAVPDGAC